MLKYMNSLGVYETQHKVEVSVSRAPCGIIAFPCLDGKPLEVSFGDNLVIRI